MESHQTELRDDEEKIENRLQQFRRWRHPTPTARHRISRRPGQMTSHSTIVDQNTVDQKGDIDRTTDLPIEGAEELLRLELPFGNFREVEWPGVVLNGRDAHGADFSAANLTDMCALGANLANIQLEEAQLQNAAICGTNLSHANLRHADLRNANLTWSDCRGAILFGADLRNANLAWTDLRDTDLRQANLSGAYYNAQTKLPNGFDPDAARMINVGESR